MNCKNCKFELAEHHDFCYNCGAKVIEERLTLRFLMRNFAVQFLNYDNRLLKTFIHLFTRPHEVIQGYITGLRKRYVNVISYFAIALSLAGLQLYISNTYFPDLQNLDVLVQEGQESFAKDLYKSVIEYQSIMAMLNVPLYALMARIVFFNRKAFNYIELLVGFMYMLAQINIVTVVITIGLMLFGVSLGETVIYMAVFQLIYISYCIIKLYALRWSEFLLRLLLLFIVSAVVFALFSMLYVMLIYMIDGREGLDQLIQSQGQVN